MLDQFSRVDISDNDRGIEWRINLFDSGHGPLIPDADHEAVRLHQVLNREAFAQELRVADNVEIHSRLAISLDSFGHLIACFYRDGALIDHDLVARQSAGNLPGHLLDKAQINR